MRDFLFAIQYDASHENLLVSVVTLLSASLKYVCLLDFSKSRRDKTSEIENTLAFSQTATYSSSAILGVNRNCVANDVPCVNLLTGLAAHRAPEKSRQPRSYAGRDLG